MDKVEKHLTAAESSELELLRKLLGEKAEVDARNEYGQTPLYRAAEK
jgi:ankyrin repeat protein